MERQIGEEVFSTMLKVFLSYLIIYYHKGWVLWFFFTDTTGKKRNTTYLQADAVLGYASDSN